MAENENGNMFRAAFRRFRSDPLAVTGGIGIVLLLVLALAAPLLANSKPFYLRLPDGGVSFPFVRFIFAPESPEFLIEQIFNYILLAAIWFGFLRLLPGISRKLRYRLLLGGAILILIPFATVPRKLDRTDYHELAARPGVQAVFAPIPYGPFETVARAYQAPSPQHLCGTDDIGRDVAVRMLYGARVSLAVGLGATMIVLLIGTLVGLITGYFRGWFDLLSMRLVEIIMCFPTFLLLLILMSILGDRKFEQSILIVIAVIGLTGWIGVTFLVRGETLKQSALPYIQSCRVAGIPVWRILLIHLLPNIAGPILISFTFGVAGAILAESGLSFLGFGVKPPTASWGGLLRQASDDPLSYWHLTLFPGLILFITVCSFNFTGEGLRRALSPK
ncbi:MAG: ABC transporter permease [Victivallaceae bacterium]